MRRAAGVLAVMLVLAGLTPTPAAAASVRLEVVRSPVVLGERVRLTGAIQPGAAGEEIRIVDATGRVVARATTGPHGGFAAGFVPTRNVWVRARWKGVGSPAVPVGVRARVSTRLWEPRLFDLVRITGWVRPAVAGGHVRVVLTRGGVEVARRWPRVHASGRYETELPVARPGTYRAAARFDLPDLWAGTAASGARAAPLPALSSGAKGTFVGLLEHRLVGLGYRLDGVDGVYDVRTGDAVVAFHKVQGMPRRFAVSAATWRALAAPLRPKARFRRPAAHIEIDQTRQVLYAVRDGRVAWISHVSTGKPSTPTYDGTFHVYRKVRGTYNSLYYPSYFDGGRAIHGWKDVPTYAASHGCVRFPFWNAVWIFRHAPIDTAVRIYH